MSTHDYHIANQSGADFRADLNNALLAIVTVNSSATEPSTTFAHQLWVDTANSVLKIRNAADNAWITTGVSITASNTFTGDLTGNVVGNVTGNLVGNVTGDLTGNADSADTLSTARTISLSGDVVGSASFDGSANIDIDTVVQINSITLGTDTTGDYVESLSGGTGVTVTGGTGEGSTPSVAIGQAVATTDDVTFNTITATDEFIGDIDGAIRFAAKADEALSKGDVVYVSGVSGNTTTVGKAKADDASKMPAFGMAIEDANANNNLQIVTFGNLTNIDTSNESVGEILYVSTTAGEYTTTPPTGESAAIQNIGKVLRSHAVNGSIKVGGAGRSNATGNLNDGKIFIGNASNQSSTATLDTSIVVENTNLYYTTTRANTDFDTRLATKDTGDLTEGTNLYYTTARVNSDFDTRLATKDTGDLTEGSNLYYTDARVNSAFDTRLATKDTDDLSEGTTNLYYTSARANTDFDTRLATKSTTDLAEGTNLYYTSARFDSAFTSKDTDDLSEGTTNLYYTTARFDSAFGNKTTADLTENTNLYYTDARANSAIDTRVTKAFVDALNIQASSVDANSVTLGTDTVGNYVATITGTANKITVSGSGSESADITLSLPDDVQIASDLTVAGNLTVNGTLTSLDTTNLDIEDNLFQLNAGLTGSPVNDSGMLINRGTADNGIFMWDESVDKFTLGLTTADGSATGNITLNSLGTLVANIEGDVTGAVTGTVSSLSNHDTGDLAEGSNLYYTQARFDSAFTGKSTSDLSEGSNLYYTDARFDTRLATKDTDDVSEGISNLYYTTARFDSAFGGKSTSDLSEGTNLYYTDARADARVNLQTGANLDLSSKSTSDLSEGTNLYYTSARANADFDTRLATKDTGDLSEGTNLYYTDARVQAVSINNVVEDTTPQLGGNLDLNSSDITGTGDINITGTITSSSAITGSTGSFTRLDINATNTQLKGDLFAHTDAAYDIGASGASRPRNLYLSNSINAADITTTGAANVGSLTVDTSTLVVDATNNRVGIGTSSPTRKFHVVESANNDVATFINNDATNGYGLNINAGGTASGRYALRVANQANSVVLQANADGNVGIGESSPDAPLHITSNTPIISFDESDAGQEYRIGSFGGAFAVYDSTDSAYRLVVDGSGNVGIGTTSPNSYSGQTALTINSSGVARLDLNIGNTIQGHLLAESGYTGLFAESGNSLRFGTGSERMRLDSSGNLTLNSGNILYVESVTAGRYGAFFTDATGTELRSHTSSGEPLTLNSPTGNIRFRTNASERMRIGSSGNLLVGNSYDAFNARANIYASGSGTSTITLNLWNGGGSGCIYERYVNSGGAAIGSITQNGASAVSFNTTSDARLKDVTGEARGLEVINELNPVAYNWKEDGKADEGLIAQEVLDIVPNAVTGSEEEMYQMDYSKLVVHLVAGMKEQQAQIEALQSEINLLKGE